MPTFRHEGRKKCVFRTILTVCLTLSILFTPALVLPGRAAAGSLSTSAEAAILVSTEGDVLYQKNADARLPMASTTKIMTALVVAENADPEQVITVPGEAVGIEGSSAYLIRAEQLTVRDLLYALLLQSANDAAEALAIFVAGSVEDFSGMMNRKAAEMGLTNTHFTNPHGLDDEEHYTSAADLAAITVRALENPTVAEIAATKTYVSTSVSGVTRYFSNHNRLLRTYEGAIGMKTGYTRRTGRCLVSAASRDGLTLVAVTLRDPNDWSDHKRMLDYGFTRFEKISLAAPGEIRSELPLTGGVTSRVRVSNRDTLDVWIPVGEADSVSTVIEHREFEFAPVSKDASCGKIIFIRNGREIGSLALYPEWDVDAEEIPPTFWQKVRNFFLKILRFIGDLFAKRRGNR